MLPPVVSARPAPRYRVCPVAPHAHLFEVAIWIDTPPDGPLTFSLPAWIPGSYMIRDFARHLVSIAAYTVADSAPLILTKLDKQTWTLDPAGASCRLVYRVYAWELSVRAAHLDHTHAYFNGPALLLRVHGLDHLPCELELLPPPADLGAHWQVATSLQPSAVDAHGFGRYVAEDYADLIDHPVEMGAVKMLTFWVQDVPHRVALTGRCVFDSERFLADLTRICAEHGALFGELPLDRYLFLMTLLGDGYGGLEHRYSTSLLCARDDLPPIGEDAPSDGYQRLLGLCSHEYFHLWLVKRIRPQALIDASLAHEAPTRTLWAFEGITAYYDELALVRAGCITPTDYLSLIAQNVTRLARTPGRRVQSLAESSFDAWIKFYKADENAPNALVSYYAKGALVALMLDLTLRRETEGRCSLDTVMRELWRVHGRTGIGVAERGVEALATAVSGVDLSGFFAQALDSTDELDPTALLASVGVALRWRPSRGEKDLGGAVAAFAPLDDKPRLTLAIRLRSGETVIQTVLSGGAGEEAGLASGDQLLAINGLRVTATNCDALLNRLAATGEPLTLHLFRRDELLTLTAQPQPAAADTCELCLMDNLTEPVRQAQAAWLASCVVGQQDG